jgi:putative ABC transport system permease protein
MRWEATEPKNIILFDPFTQWPVDTAFYLFRTTLPAKQLAPQIRRTIAEIDSLAAVVWIKSMEERIDEALWQRRLWGTLFAIFAGLAVVLAAVGLYGVLADSVEQQRREFGVRLAVGASPGAVQRHVIARGIRLVIVGIAVGVVLSTLSLTAIRSLVDTDVLAAWTTYAWAPILLVAVSVAASVVPGIRA